MKRNFDRQFPLRARLVAHRFKAMKLYAPLVLAAFLSAFSAPAQDARTPLYPQPCGPTTQAGALCVWPATSYRVALVGHGIGSRSAEPQAVIPGMEGVLLLGPSVPGWTQRTFALQLQVTYSDCKDPDEPGHTGWAWSGGLFGSSFCPVP